MNRRARALTRTASITARLTAKLTATTAAATLALLATGCPKKEAPAPAAAPPPAAPSAPAAPAAASAGTGVIKGIVKLTGTPPEMPMLKREADPYCGRKAMKDEDVVVGPGGGLGNVMVRITQGVTGSYPAPPAPARIDQIDCMYRPRVQGIVAGQPLLVGNGDQTLHNVHTYKGPSTIFNQAQIPGMAPMTKKLDEVGAIVKFKCDVHPWMTGYVAVSSHPFFAVTGGDGTFSIGKVPAGKYTLEAWHERFGTKSAEITVADGAPATADFAFESK